MQELSIDATIRMRYLAHPLQCIPLKGVFSYRTSDPLAVRLELFSRNLPLSTWTFSRDLLMNGLGARSGEGDVEVWPSVEAQPRTLYLALSGATSVAARRRALLCCSAPAAERFVQKTVALVPPGNEELGLEAALAALLS
ncbi:SsgA family sporulation/cell division regulator [Streptomyces sp. 135]|uniref:SsgA family sporulation/cell division regulator n=1 Tax=Streptomyces sp. 135 TaxID=2838850 RepID=UPI001CC1A665|nr:SsgA family sporulation/cell division regulator [Streptomyces sp. 135]